MTAEIIPTVSTSTRESPRNDIYEELRHSVLSIADKKRLDPTSDLETIKTIIANVVKTYNHERAVMGSGQIVNEQLTISRLNNSIFGFGPLTEILTRTDVEEIFIEGSRISYIDSTGYLRGLSTPTSEIENRHVIERLLSDSDRTLTTKSPLVQARVLNGQARLSASIAPISDHLSATIRKYVVKNISLKDLAGRGSISTPAAGFLWAAMQTRSRIVISGEPGAGKTTLLSALLLAVPGHHCVRCCEEIREIAVEFAHGGYYEVRPNGVDGTGEISLRDLVKFNLAMRPDRIVCGEVRGAEAFELSRAVNAGCGFACTVHSNNAVDGLEALVNASLMAGENVSETTMRNIFSSAIDLVVHVDRSENASDEDGISRGVMEILALEPALGNSFTTTSIFSRSSLAENLELNGQVPSVLATKINKALPNGLSVEKIVNGLNVFESWAR
ncbi:MAG TPA: ATPase, T2SS/T4P/T4SS family [Acidimicrobiia bacterium]|nr:ATPase, T2SS/T4P/T4SS family [Acidimicrobiia bacterium]